MSDYKLVPVELLKDWHDRINTIAAEIAFNVADEMEPMIATAPAVQGEPVGRMRFEYRHPKNGEIHVVSLSREEVAERMDQELFEKLTEAFCECAPIGETNVVDCRCDEYAEEFELVAAPHPAEQKPELAKYQPCGCVICTCEHETQCQGCGGKHCGTHPVGQIPGPVYQHPAPDVAGLVGALETVVFYHEEVEDNDGRLLMYYSKMMRKVHEALAPYRKQGGE